MKNIHKILIFISALALAFGARAISLSTPNDFFLSVSPTSPNAGENFTVEAKSYAFDLTRAKIVWFLNGAQIASGVGLSSQIFTAGALGSRMEIRVSAVAENGLAYEAAAGVAPSDIDFIISPQTYTPDLYRGAALATPGSVVLVFAVPHLYSDGAKLKPQNLIYEWSLDNQPVNAQSGGGQNKFSLKLADVGNSSYTVSLKASSLDGSVFAEKSVSVKTYSPEIVFYETNPLTGERNLALDSFSGRAGDQFSILAEPYFFALESLGRAKFAWSANGENISQPEGKAANPRELDLAAPANTASGGVFDLKINDAEAIFQQAEAAFNVSISP